MESLTLPLTRIIYNTAFPLYCSVRSPLDPFHYVGQDMCDVRLPVSDVMLFITLLLMPKGLHACEGVRSCPATLMRVCVEPGISLCMCVRVGLNVKLSLIMERKNVKYRLYDINASSACKTTKHLTKQACIFNTHQWDSVCMDFNEG